MINLGYPWDVLYERFQITLDPSWRNVISDEVVSIQGQYLFNFLAQEIKTEQVLPTPSLFFAALNSTPFSKVKVVILGQDPYPDPKYAEGLAFSVPNNVRIPGSLQNIFTEIKNDLKLKKERTSGNLIDWAKQGVLLLNTTLSVRAFSPASHYGNGWEILTSKMIRTLSSKRENLVFILWGTNAIGLSDLIDHDKHLVLKSSHPSFRSFEKPCGNHPPFKGSRPFTKTNEYLIRHGKSPIVWTQRVLES